MNKLLAISLFIFFTLSGYGETALERHGQLKVEKNQILNEKGKPVQLAGMSLFWSQWQGKYYTKKVVNWLVEDWKVTLVRAAMGVKHEESESGYLYDGTEEDKVIRVVDAAIKKGIYVIIDWHDHHAHKHTEEAIKFFTKMAQKYGKHPNVIYEIYNEPEKVSWNEVVKPYAEKVIKAIRSVDEDNLIVVGTPNWCQYVDEASLNPIEGKNIAYSLHFYASSHGADIRSRAQKALNNGLPLFVTEFGTCLASGDGFMDTTETNKWFDFLDKNNISWCNWSIADKKETSAALNPGARNYGKWRRNKISPSGFYIRSKLRTKAGFKENLIEKKKKKESWLKFKPIN